MGFFVGSVLVILAQLGHHLFETFGDRHPQSGQIFDNTQAFVGDVEKDHRRAQGFPGTAQQGGIQQVTHAHHGKDQDFFKNPPKALGAGQAVLLGGGQHSSEVVDDHKGGQAEQKAVPATEELAEQTAEQGPDQGDFVGN